MYDSAQQHTLETPRWKRETFDIANDKPELRTLAPADDSQCMADVETPDEEAALLEKARKHARATTEVSNPGSRTQPAERHATGDNFLVRIGSEDIVFSIPCVFPEETDFLGLVLSTSHLDFALNVFLSLGSGFTRRALSRARRSSG